MKTFKLKRNFDETGISGTGIVGEGVVFSDGICVFRWITKDKPKTTVVFEKYDDFYDIHCKSHPKNKSEIIWTKFND